MRTRVSCYGMCDTDMPHPMHHMPRTISEDFHVIMQECPGQVVHCRNCDDTGCMGCIFREYDHDCEWDCPFCKQGDADYVDPLFEEGVT